MERVDILIPKDELEIKVKELAQKISEDYAGKEIYAICVLKGGVVFMIELIKELEVPVEMNYMAVSSYKDGTESSGKIDVIMDMDLDLTGKHVLFVEDIIDSGRTIEFLIDRAMSRNAASVKVCAILSKPSRRVCEVPLDYIGFEVPDEFIVGYGLDFNQRYRDLNYIGILNFEETDDCGDKGQ